MKIMIKFPKKNTKYGSRKGCSTPCLNDCAKPIPNAVRRSKQLNAIVETISLSLAATATMQPMSIDISRRPTNIPLFNQNK